MNQPTKTLAPLTIFDQPKSNNQKRNQMQINPENVVNYINIDLHESDVNGWKLIGYLDFLLLGLFKYSLKETDPGIKWTIENGKGCWRGVSLDHQWPGNGIIYNFDGDDAPIIAFISVFEINHFNDIQLIPYLVFPYISDNFGGNQLIALWAFTDSRKSGYSPLCMYLQVTNGVGRFFIQTNWLTYKYELIMGSLESPIEVMVDGVHSMLIMLNRKTSIAYYFYDKKFLGAIKIFGKIEPINKIMLDVETPEFGLTTDLYFKLIKVIKRDNFKKVHKHNKSN